MTTPEARLADYRDMLRKEYEDMIAQMRAENGADAITDARLIASAPTLLEALETLLLGYDSLVDGKPNSNLIAGARLARAAIQQAKEKA